MTHVPTVLKSDRSVFDKMLPVDDNATRCRHILPSFFLFEYFILRGIFFQNRGKKHTFWRREWGRISAPKTAEKKTDYVLYLSFVRRHTKFVLNIFKIDFVIEIQ